MYSTVYSQSLQSSCIDEQQCTDTTANQERVSRLRLTVRCQTCHWNTSYLQEYHILSLKQLSLYPYSGQKGYSLNHTAACKAPQQAVQPPPALSRTPRRKRAQLQKMNADPQPCAQVVYLPHKWFQLISTNILSAS